MNKIIYRAEDYILKTGSNSVYRIEKILNGKKATKIRVSNQKSKSETSIPLSAIERRASWDEVMLKRRVLEVDQADSTIKFTGSIRLYNSSMIFFVDRTGFKSWSVEEAVWNSQLHIQVFNLILNELDNLGYSIKQQEDIFVGPGSKYCRKGDLRLDAKVDNGRIELKFYQNVNAPNRPDNGGRYEHDQHKLMPYLMFLEMCRTQQRIKRLILGNFEFSFDHEFQIKNKCEVVGPQGVTILEKITADYAEKGISEENLKADDYGYNSSYNNQSADKKRITQGQQVWFYDRKKRLNIGKAYYRSNSMWWVVTGKYGYAIESSHSLYVEKPHDIWEKGNKNIRKQKISQVIFDAKNNGNLNLANKLQNLFDQEFNEEGLFITRDQARKYFNHIGLTYGHITLARVKKLHAILDSHLKANGIFDNSFHTHKDIGFEFTEDGGMAHASIMCSANYFTGRQAIEFEKNGFIGFAGWAGDDAVKPILEAFVEWCDLIKKEVAA